MKKLRLPEALLGLLAWFALTTPIFAGTIIDPNLTISSPTDGTTISISAAPEISKLVPGRADSSNNMPAGTRSYFDSGDTKTYAFSTTCDFLNAANLMRDDVISLSSVNFGRIPFQQLLIVSPKGAENSSFPVAQLPEPASLILIGTGLAALGLGMKKRKSK